MFYVCNLLNIITRFRHHLKSVKTMFDLGTNALKSLFVATQVYILWIALHFVASHLYIHVCVPQTWIGLLMSPFVIVTPQCQALRWVIFNGAMSVHNMWILLGTWFATSLLSLHLPLQRRTIKDQNVVT